MRKTALAGLTIGIAAFGGIGTAVAAETYAIDASHSSVGFGVKHMMVATVRGSFSEVKGTVVADPKDLGKSSVEVEIAAASVSTGNADRDKHLRSADFFDVEKFPVITFKSTNVERRGDGYLASGTLTMKGVSKPVTLAFSVAGPVTDPWGNVRYGLDFEPLKLNRRDYGLTWSKALETGGLVVSDEVTVQLAVELIQQKPPAAAK